MLVLIILLILIIESYHNHNHNNSSTQRCSFILITIFSKNIPILLPTRVPIRHGGGTTKKIIQVGRPLEYPVVVGYCTSEMTIFFPWEGHGDWDLVPVFCGSNAAWGYGCGGVLLPLLLKDFVVYPFRCWGFWKVRGVAPPVIIHVFNGCSIN